MSIIDTILIGVTYALATALAISVAGAFLLATWMQAMDERTESHEQKASTKESGCAAPASQRRRRRAACGHPGQMP